MALLRTTRRLQPVGGSSYVPIPRRALLELRLFTGDWCEWILDTDAHTLTLRAVKRRDLVPMMKVRTHDMAPDDGAEPDARAAADDSADAPVLLELSK
jgi:hypothetical protein